MVSLKIKRKICINAPIIQFKPILLLLQIVTNTSISTAYKLYSTLFITDPAQSEVDNGTELKNSRHTLHWGDFSLASIVSNLGCRGEIGGYTAGSIRDKPRRRVRHNSRSRGSLAALVSARMYIERLACA